MENNSLDFKIKDLPKDKAEIARELLLKIADIEKSEELENILKNNVIEFKIKDKKYRLRYPTYNDKLEVKNKRNEKYLELLKDPKSMFKKQLIALYKQKGIDIEQFQKERDILQNEIEKLMLKLAELSQMPDTDPSVIELKAKILSLKEEQSQLLIQEQDLLSCSIESILIEYTQTYLAYLLLETEDNGKWVKSFNSYEEFCNNVDVELFTKAIYYLNLVINISPI